MNDNVNIKHYSNEELKKAIGDYDSNKITKMEALEIISNLMKNGDYERLVPFTNYIHAITDRKEKEIKERKKKIGFNEGKIKSKEPSIPIMETTLGKNISKLFGFGKKVVKEVNKAYKERTR